MKSLLKSALFILLLFFVFSCTSGKKAVLVFEDSFERAEIGDNYEIQGGDWRIENGKLKSRTAKNRNLVLKSVDLPQNGIVELTMKSHSDAVDVKSSKEARIISWADKTIYWKEILTSKRRKAKEEQESLKEIATLF